MIVEINYNDLKLVLSVPLVLFVNDYTNIKTKERPWVGLKGEQIAELTKLEWVIVSHVSISGVIDLFFFQSFLHYYENMCSLYCLCIEENHVKSDDLVY